jgi:hypothetical protein
MKILSQLSLSIIALTTALTVFAQERTFIAVDYMHVPDSSSEAEYLSIEKLWQRIHQKAADEGICLGWYLYRVENGGRNQFATVRVYDSAAKAVSPWSAPLSTLVKELYSAEEQGKMAKTGQARILTRSELYELGAAASRNIREPEGNYNVVNFMKATPGKEGAYYDAEVNIFQKAHKAGVEAGRMKNWRFLSRVFPSGAGCEYDFVTMDSYADKDAMEKPIDMEKIQKALTEKELKQAQTVDELRTVIRREVWHPIARVLPEK